MEDTISYGAATANEQVTWDEVDHDRYRIGFGIECTPGYKARLRDAASQFIGQLIAQVNRKVSPLDMAKREASTTRLNVRRQKEARLISALPDTLPATAAALSTSVPEGVLAQVVLQVENRSQVDALFGRLPGLPLVVESTKFMDGSQRGSIRIEQVAELHQETWRPGIPKPPARKRIAPFYWRHIVQPDGRFTSVVWYAQLSDERGPFLAEVQVDVLDDPAKAIIEPAEEAFQGASTEEAGSTVPLQVRLLGAPDVEFTEVNENPGLPLAFYRGFWPESVTRPSDVFGRAEVQV